jgi:diguanylate cyclase (GGDEF)-like protein
MLAAGNDFQTGKKRPMAKTDLQKGPQEHRSQTLLNNAILVVGLLFAFVLAATMYLTLRNNAKLESILEDSVKAELLAVCFAAGEIVLEHKEAFSAINDEDDIDRYRKEFDSAIAGLRLLRDRISANDSVNVKYIYALKKIGGKYYFIFDTDEEAIEHHDDGDPATEGVVTEYTEIAKVHLDAFAGQSSVDMNAKDQWGSYHTGTLPLRDPESGQVIGVIAIDIDDNFIRRFQQTSASAATFLAVIMAASMSALLFTLILLISRHDSMQTELYRMANHDAITGLPNRHNLFHYLERKSQILSTSFPPFAMFFVDLDNFKQVNDSAGHDAGDELLRNISAFLISSQQDDVSRLRNSEDPDDHALDAITARIGGDEFLQITPGVTNEEDAVAVAAGMLKNFQAQSALKPFIQDFGIGLSIGIALFPPMSSDYNELMKLADIAMYQAKFNGKNSFAVYRPEMSRRVKGRKLSIR